MELLEYQSKELFRQMGIPVLPSQHIFQPKDLKGLTIPYPVVLKSQVPAGGRGRVGGVRVVETTIDAIAAAQTIFHLPIRGLLPKVLLAEAKFEAKQEFYLAIVLDSRLRCPVLLGSCYGGMEIDLLFSRLHQVVVEQPFLPYYARRLAIKMGLSGELIEAVSAIVEKMYRLFEQMDLDLIEIHPLAVNAKGDLMALDGKISLNNAALGRQQDLASLIAQIPNHPHVPIAASSTLKLMPLQGTIGIIGNGAGSTLATLDSVYQAQGQPACAVDLAEAYPSSAHTAADRLEQALRLVTRAKGVRAVLMNSFDPDRSIEAESLLRVLKRHPRTPPLVVRLWGNELAKAQRLLAEVNVAVYDQLPEAIDRVIALANGAASSSRLGRSLRLQSKLKGA